MLPADRQDPFDLQSALSRLGNNRELLNDLVGFFLEDYPALLDQLGKAIDEKNTQLAARSAHSLKGLSASFDSHVVVHLAGQIEELAGGGDFAGARTLVQPLTGELARLRDALAAHLDRQKALGA
jgi:HPt (histidine-containing phosphotransfer) domain-containing protein